jgi:hypothetical protein
MEGDIRDGEVVDGEKGEEKKLKETLAEKYKRVGLTIENLLKAEGLQMDVIHQVFFRPIQPEKTPIIDASAVSEVPEKRGEA